MTWQSRLLLACATLLVLHATPTLAQAPEVARGVSLVVDKKPPSRRVALIVGIGRYSSQPLDNPVRDATAMEAVLRESGFDTDRVYTDSGRMEMVRALESFRQRLRGAAVAVFYFAGHGVQMDGQNFLIPVDADMNSEDQVKYNTVRLEDVLAMLDQSGVPAKMVILDACRNNPFERGRGGSGGLAAITSAPKGTLIAYATAPGRVALDGERGKHGLYTGQLLEAIRSSAGQPVEEIFKRTRARVVELSRGRQIPWESTSLEGRLVLREGTDSAPDRTMVAVAPEAVGAAGAARGLTTPTQLPGIGGTFRDCPRCPEMVVIPPGEFQMGAPPAEAGRQAIEGPPTLVRIADALAVGRFEVTFDEWQACVIEGGCDHWPGEGLRRARNPVAAVSWEDAKRYIEWLNRHTRRKSADAPQYRLLSEAEWEYVARAGTSTARPWGEALGTGTAHCRDCGTPPGTRTATPNPRFANPWGLHDMLGNVWEWVQDCRAGDLASHPKDGSARLEGDCSQRGVRGGAWSTSAKGVRAATRGFYPVSRRDAAVGFRVAMTIKR